MDVPVEKFVQHDTKAKMFLANQRLASEVRTLRSVLTGHRAATERLLQGLEPPKEELTGWYAFFLRAGKGKDETWRCVGVVDAYADEDEIPEEFHVCLAIPTPESLPEFDGF